MGGSEFATVVPVKTTATLGDLLDPDRPYVADEVLDDFLTWTADQGIELYPAQEEAVFELAADSNVVLATPTGTGKSLVAVAAQFFAAARGERSFYTAPIKALVSEKFFALCEVFGAANVGMLTGDASVNPGAPIVCATAEILANIALREGADADVGTVVMDEFHYYGERDRGWAWQVPIVELPRAQFLLMSATLGEVDFFVSDLTERTGRATALVAGVQRPVPLEFEYSVEPIHETIERLIAKDRAPVYVVHFTQQAAVERAQALLSLPLADKQRKAAIVAELTTVSLSTGFGKQLGTLLRAGIGVHHAGMLPRYRRLVERLAGAGLLVVICGTDTLGVGINVPIRTVLLTALTKYDGSRVRHLRAREFHQIVGRAGRPGFDTVGYVVVEAPEHDIENARLEAKTTTDPKKRRKFTRKKAPEGTVSWGRGTFERLVDAAPEPLTSQFRIDSATLLNLAARPGSLFAHARHLLEQNHEPRSAQLRHIRTAIERYRSLRDSGVLIELAIPDENGRSVVLGAPLQRDFALNQPLSPFALAALELLDPEADTYALDAVSVIEATLDDPRQVLMAQQKAARGEAIAALKADGVEYEERMALIEDITWPRPLADELFDAFDVYRVTHPWLSRHLLSPKSVVREMVELAMTFNEFVQRYGLARSEGTLLRYLTDAYRALRQTIPTAARTRELSEIIWWLGDLIRAVDSSLIDEWEQFGGDTADDPAPPPRAASANERGFTIAVRNTMFALVTAIARQEWKTLAAADPAVDQHSIGAEAIAWREEFDEFFAEYGPPDDGPAARGPQYLGVERVGRTWRVRQTLVDPDGDLGWALLATIDLDASDAAGEPVLTELAVEVG